MAWQVLFLHQFLQLFFWVPGQSLALCGRPPAPTQRTKFRASSHGATGVLLVQPTSEVKLLRNHEHWHKCYAQML